MLKAVQNSLLSLVFPLQCRVCAGHAEFRDDGVACPECWSVTRIFDGSEMLCQKCGALLGSEARDRSVSCGKCSDHFYDRAVSCGVYEKALAATIVQLKRSPVLPQRVITVIHNSLQRAELSRPDVIIPVPLSKQRHIERGFNQAVVIANAVARVLDVEVDEFSLTRKLHTPIHRIGMDRKARELTVRKAFQVSRPRLVVGKHVLLVDDVFTSGATASACAQVLKRSGVPRADVFTLGRAVMH